jgi:UDP-N-acetylmuramyl pentapeptide phosphotransferase/UDP-N-acetylglucosamine-1-phosphate transferase
VIAAGLACFVVALIATPIVAKILRRAGAMDVPVDRSSHDAPTPRGGGLAVLGAWAIGLALVVSSIDDGAGRFRTVFMVACVLGVVGLADDIRGGASAVIRLALTAATAGIAVISIVSGETSGLELLGMSVVGTVWITGYTNTFNFMDGINGISGMTGAVTALALALVARDLGSDAVAAAMLGIVGALLGFLGWNLRGRVFLGDIGSYAIGGALATTLVVLVDDGASIERCIGAFLPYIADTGFTFVRRLARRERVLDPHSDHAYQLLVRRGASHAQVAVLVAGLSAVCAAITWAASELDGSAGLVLDALAIGVAVTYAVGIPQALSPKSTVAPAAKA